MTNLTKEQNTMLARALLLDIRSQWQSGQRLDAWALMLRRMCRALLESYGEKDPTESTEHQELIEAITPEQKVSAGQRSGQRVGDPPKSSKVVVELAELADLITVSIKRTLLAHAGPAQPKGFALAATSRGPEVYRLPAGQSDDVFEELGRNAASDVWATGVEIDFDSETAEEDPSAFVIGLRDAWQQRKE